MSRCSQLARPLVRHLQQASSAAPPSFTLTRSFSQTATALDVSADLASKPTPPSLSPLDLDPNTVATIRGERALAKAGNPPIGSRRRRVAIRTTQNIPFEQLPYQCFQEARKILREDREEKVAALQAELNKIARLEATDGSQLKGGEPKRQLRLKSLRQRVEELKILADINDPIVKRNFEDGLGDMNKPIYRYLAERRWRSYDHKLISQRIEQFHIIPDLLPKFEPTADVQLWFRRFKIAPGAVVDSLVSEVPPRLNVQVFDKGERLVSVVVLDADVPDLESDSFSKRCHFLAANIPISPTITSMPFSRLSTETQIAVPWLPAFAQKGAPAHRLAIFVLEQGSPVTPLDVAKLRDLYTGREGFSIKSFRDKFGLKPFGFNIFRTKWDDNTAAVMDRAGMPGAELEFRHKRVYSMKTPRKAKGWEAKRQGPKYRHLWKYTKRIRGLSNARGWTKKGN